MGLFDTWTNGPMDKNGVYFGNLGAPRKLSKGVTNADWSCGKSLNQCAAAVSRSMQGCSGTWISFTNPQTLGCVWNTYPDIMYWHYKIQNLTMFLDIPFSHWCGQGWNLDALLSYLRCPEAPQRSLAKRGVVEILLHLSLPPAAATQCQKGLGSCCCHHDFPRSKEYRGWHHPPRPHPNLNSCPKWPHVTKTSTKTQFNPNAWTALQHETAWQPFH